MHSSHKELVASERYGERESVYREWVCMQSVCRERAGLDAICMQKESGSVCGEPVCVWRAGLYTSLTSELAEGEAHL